MRRPTRHPPPLLLQKLRAWASSDRAGPDVLTVYIALIVVVAIALPLSGFAALQAVMAVCGAASITLLWLTHLTDPGFLPRGVARDALVCAAEDAAEAGAAGASAPATAAAGAPRTTSLAVSAAVAETPAATATAAAAHHSLLRRDARGAWTRPAAAPPPAWRGPPLYDRFCDTCDVWRPPRAHHCNECGRCVAKYDHHCSVVGACVGGGNHRFFAGFLVAALAGCCVLAGGAALGLRARGFPAAAAAARHAETWATLFLGIVGAWHALALVAFGGAHAVFVLLDITTKDLLRGGHLCSNPPCLPGGRNPRRLLSNLQATCCAPIRWRLRSAAEEERSCEDGGGDGRGGGGGRTSSLL